jgi:hypothetical protein
MAITAPPLESAIMTAYSSYNNGAYKKDPDNPQHLKIMGDTMKDYFEANIEVTYEWSAKSPPSASTPDPATSFKSTVHFPDFDLTSAHSLDDLAECLKTVFSDAVINHASGFTVAPGSFLVSAAPPLGRTTDTASAILTCICVPVRAWVLTLANSAPLSGTHDSYKGATTGMAIA